MNPRTLLLAAALAFGSFAAAATDPVNINTADAATLSDRLNGVGPAKAEAIVAHREENGPFKSIDQLAEVPGIGLKTVEKNRETMTLGSPRPAAKAPATDAAAPAAAAASKPTAQAPAPR